MNVCEASVVYQDFAHQPQLRAPVVAAGERNSSYLEGCHETAKTTLSLLESGDEADEMQFCMALNDEWGLLQDILTEEQDFQGSTPVKGTTEQQNHSAQTHLSLHTQGASSDMQAVNGSHLDEAWNNCFHNLDGMSFYNQHDSEELHLEMTQQKDVHGEMVTLINCPAREARRKQPRELAECLGQLAASLDCAGLPTGFDAAQKEIKARSTVSCLPAVAPVLVADTILAADDDIAADEHLSMASPMPATGIDWDDLDILPTSGIAITLPSSMPSSAANALTLKASTTTALQQLSSCAGLPAPGLPQVPAQGASQSDSAGMPNCSQLAHAHPAPVSLPSSAAGTTWMPAEPAEASAPALHFIPTAATTYKPMGRSCRRSSFNSNDGAAAKRQRPDSDTSASTSTNSSAVPLQGDFLDRKLLADSSVSKARSAHDAAEQQVDAAATDCDVAEPQLFETQRRGITGKLEEDAEYDVDRAGGQDKKQKRDVRCISLKFLEDGGYFDQPIQEAASKLDVGVTTLKKICRANNIHRWPFRKRNSIDKLIEKTRIYMRSNGTDPAGKDMQTVLTLDSLQVQRQVLQANPRKDLSPETKQARQQMFKLTYKLKKRARPQMTCL